MSNTTDEKKLKGFKNLGLYFKYFSRYKALCAGYFICLAFSGVVGFLSPLLLGEVISHVTSGENFNLALRYALLLAGVDLFGILIYMARVPFFKKTENYVKRDVKLDILKRSFNINIGEYEKLGNGTFITRLTSDLDALATSFKNISETIISFVSKIGFIVYVFILSWQIGLFLVAFILIKYFVYQIRIHYFVRLKPPVLRKNEKINSLVGECVRGIKDIKTLGLSNTVSKRVNDMQQDYMKADNKEWYVGISLCTFASFVDIVCNLLFVVLCIGLIKNNHLDLAVFYSAYIYKNNVLDFTVHLGNLQAYFKDMEVSAFRVFQLADGNVFKMDEFGTKPMPRFYGNIEFKNVCFKYTEEEDVLNNVSFKIAPKTHVAFVGESGCGKSTIVALICKLFDPTSGEILFDGVNINELSQEFGKHVSMVNQSPYLFNLTIRENMQLVKPDVTDKEIFDALRVANAYDFVSQLPQGLDSFLGEGGTRLSGGQKQRICIARALLKNSRVLIFDEATSALDNISQEYVMDSIESMKKNKTIITIAHRLTTIRSCDTIFFLDKGKIIDYGTHRQLLRRNKKYNELYNKQKKEKHSQSEE